MMSHRLLSEVGRPRFGAVFDQHKRDKLNYKAVIRSHKKNEKKTVSSELNDILLQNDSQAFWSTWKHKVCNSSEKLPCIVGCFDNAVTNEKF